MGKSNKKNVEHERLHEIAVRYEASHIQQKEFDEVKRECRDEAKDILSNLNLDVVDIEDGDSILRVQNIHKKSIQYNQEDLIKLLRSKGKNVAKQALKVVVDNEALDTLYNEGKISYDEIQQCVDKISDRTELRIQRVKGNSLDNKIKG